MSLAQTLTLDSDYESRILDLARDVLDDIRDVAQANYSIRWIDAAPVLILAFDLPETRDQAACGVRLLTVHRDPAKRGSILLPKDDRTKKHIRESIEHYLLRHGIRIPSFDN